MTTKTGSKTLLNKMTTWIKSGNSIRTIANATERDPNTVRSWVRRGNIPGHLRPAVKKLISATKGS